VIKDKVAIVSASPETIISFMSMHLEALSKEYTVYAICSDVSFIKSESLIPNVKYINIPISRKISFINDFISLLKLIHFFYIHNLVLVQSITPKAGLLSMFAAWVCRIPIRSHVFTGQVWVTRSGFSRFYLKKFDYLIAKLATSLLADSPSQIDFLVKEGIVCKEHVAVLADGSICGVDTIRFVRNEDIKFKLRNELKIPYNATVAIFMGRLKKDKGVLDLASAYGVLNQDINNLYLLFVGPDEEGLIDSIYQLSTPRNYQIRYINYVNNPEDFFAAADFICLPSYREGFGLVIVEAGSAEIPALASNIYGIMDAVVDGVTGVLHQPGDIVGITQGLMDMTINSKRRQEMGIAARNRVVGLFSATRVVDAMLNYYKILINKYKDHG
jgi:glycosyltransferase involved in cell wall biosynthesis